jgi:hypothetical protein
MFWLLNLIPGIFSTINGITSAISNEKIAALNATTQEEQIAANERISTLQAQRDVLVSDLSVSKLDIWIRSLFAAGPMFYLNKIYIYDKVLGLGSTDALDSNLWNVVMVTIGFYFLHSIGSSISKAIRS